MERNPNEAFRNYIEPLRDALHCVKLARLQIDATHTLESFKRYSVSINDTEFIPLTSSTRIGLSVHQFIRIDATEPNDRTGQFKVNTLEYVYELGLGTLELLAFHWTPDADGVNVVRFPHLHIGRALVGEQQLIRPNDFHKVHIPTGRVTLQAVLRLAITEFGVQLLRPIWHEVVQRTEKSFDA